MAKKNVAFTKKDFFFSLYLGIEIGFLFFLTFRLIKPDFQLMIRNFTIPTFAIAIFLPVFAFIAILTAFYLGTKLPILYQIGKFGFVGVGNTLVDIFTLNLLMAILFVPEQTIYKVLFISSSFLMAVIHSFILNKLWTFQKKETKKTAQEFLTFLIITLLGFTVHTGIATAVSNFLSKGNILSGNLSLNVGKIFGIFFSLVWDFTGYKLFVFKKNPNEKQHCNL